jgi:hypothetical protein
MKGSMLRWGFTMATVVCATVVVAADTLYLRDGSRVEGELIRVDAGRLEFREGSGWGSKTLRFDLAEVQRIDFSGRDDSPVGGIGRPGGMREREVIVSADVPWIDTGIDVRSGQTVYFETLGKVRWGKNRQDGPAGENNSPRNPGRPIPNRPAAALVGSVGGPGQDIFFIGGETGALRLRAAGRLYLGINDDVFTDNSGNFRVTVYY